MGRLTRMFSFRNLALVFAALLLMIGCETQSPVSPSPVAKIVRSTDQMKFLHAKTIRFEKEFRADQLITASDGGTISVGDDISGVSTIQFQPGDLNDDRLISFGWDSQGYVTELGPHGLVFNHPVELDLSYKDADLTGVDEDNLKIWYYNEGNDNWELIGGTVDKTAKRVEGTILHFSRYAIGDTP
jgi:hypothetical protein